LSLSPPVPILSISKIDYIKQLGKWFDAEPKFKQLIDVFYINEFDYTPEFNIEGTFFFMFDGKAIGLILDWFHSVLTGYKELIQSDVIKMFDCEKFATSPEGNACQLIRREGKEVTSQFLLPVSDATIGTVFNYNHRIEMLGDFAGLVKGDPYLHLIRTVSNGLVKLIKT